MKRIYFSNFPAKTKKIGERLAKEILKKEPKKTAQILALVGNLGSGKTTFLKGLAKGLGIKEEILSPTFLIMKKFKINSHFSNFYHFDCYRIKRKKELLDLDFKKIISFPKNIVAIEWAEKIKNLLPKETLWIYFHFLSQKKRKIEICDKIKYGK